MIVSEKGSIVRNVLEEVDPWLALGLIADELSELEVQDCTPTELAIAERLVALGLLVREEAGFDEELDMQPYEYYRTP